MQDYLPDHRIADIFFEGALIDILEIKFIEIREAAVSASDGEVVAADEEIMHPLNSTVPAGRCRLKTPDIITGYRCVISNLSDLRHLWDEDPGSSAVRADDLGLLRNDLDHLVGIFMAMITVDPVPG